MSAAKPQPFPPLAHSNINSLWGAFTARLLVKFGVEQVVISPGSRSTPLTYAMAQEPALGTTPVLDERSAAFYALGLAKTSGSPVALVSTSGTAAANYFPAIIEAHESGTPLVVLTADRPPELRYSHAGQTIDQLKLYDDAVRFFAEAPIPEPKEPLFHSWRETLRHAVDVAKTNRGPVHLNCPFRDPLPPQEGTSLAVNFDAVAMAEMVRSQDAISTSSVGMPALPARTLVVTGSGIDLASISQPARTAIKSGWPVLADGLTPLRFLEEDASPLLAPITAYDRFLRDARLAAHLCPEAVVQLGDLPTSKVLRQWLSQLEVPVYLIDAQPIPRNASFGPAQRLAIDPNTFLRGLAEVPMDQEWLDAWRDAEDTARANLNQALDAEETLREPHVARALSRQMPPSAHIFLASSMPVRDWETFAEASRQQLVPLVNRGANGIDGTLSSALGMAAASAKSHNVLYTGDLAFLHDTNGLLLASSGHWQGNLTVVCVNNGGGGIFGHLPIAARAEVFENYFATPQQVDLGKLVSAYGFIHEKITTHTELTAAFSTWPESGLRFLEVVTDRASDAAWRKAL